MRVDSIASFTGEIMDGQVAFIFKKKKWTHLDLRRLFTKFEDQINLIKHKNVVINARSNEECALLLYILDGTAARILLLPHDLGSGSRSDYLKQAEIAYQVSFSEDNVELLIEATDVSFETQNNKNKQLKQTEWIIPTSGTTKAPKLVAHSIGSLTRSVQMDHTKGENYRWGLVYDIYRFAGLQVYLQALIGGSTLIVHNNADISQMLRFFAENQCNVMSATPSFWRKALMSNQINNLDLKSITLGGEISDKQVLNSLHKKFPTAKIRHIYASTEAGVGFTVTDGKEGFPLSYVTDGVNNVSLKINEENHLLIKPADKSQRYLSAEDMYLQDGYIDTGDVVKVDEDRVYFCGRASGAINVGGNKVQPEEVENCILESGLVNQALVYAKSNPIMGSLVVAEIVIPKTSDQKQIKKELLTYCKQNLVAHKVPAIIKVVETIEITASGKVKRGIK